MDFRILSELQRNSKLTNVELAARVGLSPSPCLARVRALERAAVIKRYVALVEPDRLGLTLNVFIQVTLEKQTEKVLREFETRMRVFPEVMECYLMTGDSDYLLRVLVHDIAALQNFIIQTLSNVPGVSNIRSSFALKQVKYETAMPVGS